MPEAASFAAQAQNIASLLVIDFGGLGDHIHSLPALWALRRALPQARLDILGGPGLFGALAPWMDHAPELEPGHGFRQNLRQVRAIRRQRYEATMVFTSSNHAVSYGGLSGSRLRLARRSDENKRWSWQPLLLTHVVNVPYHTMPMYRQRLALMAAAGFPVPAATRLADVPARVEAAGRRAAGIGPADDGRYIHLSASATDPRRDLPLRQLTALCEHLRQQFPELRLIVSSNASERGRSRLAALLSRLDDVPWKVFSGELDTAGFASVIQGARLHVGPDSGGLHVARLVSVPSVSWFFDNHHIKNWLPDEPGHFTAVAATFDADGLCGINLAELTGAADTLLRQASPAAGPPPSMPPAGTAP